MNDGNTHTCMPAPRVHLPVPPPPEETMAQRGCLAIRVAREPRSWEFACERQFPLSDTCPFTALTSRRCLTMDQATSLTWSGSDRTTWCDQRKTVDVCVPFHVPRGHMRSLHRAHSSTLISVWDLLLPGLAAAQTSHLLNGSAPVCVTGHLRSDSNGPPLAHGQRRPHVVREPPASLSSVVRRGAIVSWSVCCHRGSPRRKRLLA